MLKKSKRSLSRVLSLSLFLSFVSKSSERKKKTSVEEKKKDGERKESR